MTLSLRFDASRRALARTVDAALAPAAGRFENESADPTVAGLFRAASGIGDSARLCRAALRDIGVAPDMIDLSEDFGQRDLAAGPGPAAPVTNTGPLIIHLNPPELPRALRRIGRDRLAGRKIIGYWAWELPDAPPAWRRAMRFVHEVWTPSAFCTAALSPGASVPVRTVPHILSAPGPAQPGLRSPDVGFHVIASGDARSSLARKNLAGSLRAFREAFGDDPGVRLSIRLGHGTAADPVVADFENRCAAFANVRLVRDIMDEPTEAAFIASADAMLSLHRAEGFGLVLAKAMRMGKPVIATGWSGNMEYMSAESGCLVGFDTVPVRDPQGVYKGADQTWAEPALDEAVTWLRRLRSDTALRDRIGESAAALYPEKRFRDMLAAALGR